jgi:NADPH2:quinone reductase
MRAWISGETPGRGSLRLQDRPEPTWDGRCLLVRVVGAALNFSDILMIDGRYQVRPSRPFTPGQEVAGVVEQAPEASGFTPGDRIVSKVDWGGFAERAQVRPDMAIRVPEEVDLLRALALPVVYMTALVALTECASVGLGDTVLVHAAAGGVGLAAVEIAAAQGARVIGTAGSPEKRALARAHGAHATVDYREPGWIDEIKRLTGGRGAEVIVDPVGGDIGEDSLRCIARDGVLLVVGFASGRIPKLAANRLLLKRASAKGVFWDHDRDGPMLTRLAETLVGMLRDHRIDPVVCADYTLEDLPRALEDLESRRSAGKLALRVSAT